MEPEVRERFDLIEASNKEGIRRAEQNERLFETAFRQAMERMDKASERADRADRRMDRAFERMDKADQRMNRFDLKLEATRKLVEAGIKLVSKLASQTRELKQSQKAFLDSLRKGNGNGHRRPN